MNNVASCVFLFKDNNDLTIPVTYLLTKLTLVLKLASIFLTMLYTVKNNSQKIIRMKIGTYLCRPLITQSQKVQIYFYKDLIVMNTLDTLRYEIYFIIVILYEKNNIYNFLIFFFYERMKLNMQQGLTRHRQVEDFFSSYNSVVRRFELLYSKALQMRVH